MHETVSSFIMNAYFQTTNVALQNITKQREKRRGKGRIESKRKKEKQDRDRISDAKNAAKHSHYEKACVCTEHEIKIKSLRDILLAWQKLPSFESFSCFFLLVILVMLHFGHQTHAYTGKYTHNNRFVQTHNKKESKVKNNMRRK